MGIAKDFYLPRRTIFWNDQEVCDVRGITPNDIARLMQENSSDMEQIVKAWERDKSLATLAGTPEGDSEQMAKAIADNSAMIFNQMISMVPNLAAKIIAVAADDPDSAEHVEKNFTLPLQFDILCAIAEMTFVNQDGFKKFVGNVLALAGNVGGKSQRQSIPQ